VSCDEIWAERRGRAPPDFLGFPENRDRFGFWSEFRALREFGIPPKRIKETSAFDIGKETGRGQVMLSALTEAALARKLKHPKGLKHHYTFRIGGDKGEVDDDDEKAV